MASQTKAVTTEEHLLRPRQEVLQKKMLRHRFEVATRKKDIVGRNREIMLRPEVMLNGLAISLLGNFRLRQRYELETPIKVATWNSCRDNKNERYS